MKGKGAPRDRRVMPDAEHDNIAACAATIR